MSKEQVIVNNYPGLNVEWVIIDDIVVSKEECRIVKNAEEKVSRNISLSDLIRDYRIRAYRDFFWSIGIDPTKERPSSEALVRRILRGKGLPRINTAVDAMNAASVESFITFGLLDVDKVSFPLIIRPSTGEDKLVVIGGKEITVPKNFPVIEDGEKRVISATIYRDGDLAKITEETKKVILIGYSPPGIERVELKNAVKKAKEYIEYCCKRKNLN